MTRSRRRLKPGYVLSIEATCGVIYLHYVGRHADYGDAIAVGRKLWKQPQPVTAQLFSEAYITFYPATAAVNQGLAGVIGELPPPNLPGLFRRVGARSASGGVINWIIDDGTSQVVKRQLSNDELKLPIASIWNHEFLIQRVSEGWEPAQEGMISM
jgi:hypothetical protein